ncbi:MAG TPA: histidine kinase N-terminal 7TM domain-containing protein [Candidatus Thermoplasmatota archaeon]|nr:histidine kinase N-terminal 7TM domain-containing protein [Candidatus Thermoplasmatota archaeon]
MALRPEILPALAAGIMMLALAALLLSFNFGHRANRAFALLLVLRGGATLTGGVAQAQDTLASALFWHHVYPYFLMPLFAAGLYFAAVYPHARRWLPSRAWAAAPFLALMALVDLAYALDHNVFVDASTIALGSSTVSGRPGALYPLVDLWDLVFGVVGLVFAVDATRSGPGPRRRSLLLVSLGFALLSLYDGLHYLGPGSPMWTGAEAYPSRAFVLTYIPTAIAVATSLLLARFARARPDADATRESRRYLFALGLAPLFVLVEAAVSPGLSGPLAQFGGGVFRLGLPVLATYALLRHQLFGIDLKIRWTIKQSTVAAAFIGLFFVVSESAQTFFSGSVGPYVGIAAAGMLVFAMAPLQRVADRVATAAMPLGKEPHAMSGDERAAVYRDNARVAWADGAIDKSERAMLDRLRASLGLGVEEAVRIEGEAARDG